MDLTLLPQLAAELDERLSGLRIDQVYALPKNDVVLVAGKRSGPRLWMSTESDQPHVYLRSGPHATPQRPPGFAMAARNMLRGRRIASIRAIPGERVVELTCGGDNPVRVVVELIPRRSTVLVVDAEDSVAAVWQPRRGRPGLGDVYAAPDTDTRSPHEAIDTATWADMALSADRRTLLRALLRSVAGMTPLIAREIVAAHAEGAGLQEATADELARVGDPYAPCIYSPGPLRDLRSLPSPSRFVLSGYRLHHMEREDGMVRTDFADLVAAAATYYPLRASLSGLQVARRSLGGVLDAGLVRWQRTLDAVGRDATRAGKAETHRMWADLLLAYPTAERHRDAVRVPDPYAGGDAEIEIPIDPSRTNIDNAQTYYGRARRAERSAERTARRREELQGRIGLLRRLRGELDDIEDVAAAARIARSAQKGGLAVASGNWATPESGNPDVELDAPTQPSDTAPDAAPARTSGDPGIDLHTATDGYEILVGRNARANEKLSHKLAAPDDFWLHAEGPGSHVVIRNPKRHPEPPADALRQAASLAAYFSRSRGATKVNVRWTQVRHVKKPRGAPTGQVILRRSKTVLAQPLAPAELFEASDNE